MEVFQPDLYYSISRRIAAVFVAYSTDMSSGASVPEGYGDGE